jgi:CRP-like cAMP-binding protein
MTTGTPLFLEGSRSDTVALVISGRIKVFSSAADGTEVVTRSTIGTAVSQPSGGN